MTREIPTVTVANGPALSYSEQGDPSDSALVLLPGPTDSWRSYEPVLDRIRLSTRTIAVSPRGHGDSEKPATGYRVEDFAGDVVGLLDVLHVEHAVLAAPLGSCLVARRVALDLPERVAGLVLEASPTTLVDNPGLTEFVETVASQLDDPIDPDVARSLLIDTSSGEVASEVLDQLVSELLKVPAGVWKEMFGALLQYDDRSEIGHVVAPVLLIWGDRDGIVSREMQEELAAGPSRADLLVYPGVGHTPRWEDPSRFATDVAAFVERLLPH